jgi:hypothetical protein
MNDELHKSQFIVHHLIIILRGAKVIIKIVDTNGRVDKFGKSKKG